jgi:hypothetical protein
MYRSIGGFSIFCTLPLGFGQVISTRSIFSALQIPNTSTAHPDEIEAAIRSTLGTP